MKGDTNMKILGEDYHDLFNYIYPKMVVISGLPGSGKSTICKEFHEHGYFVLSKDDIRHRLACMKYGYQPETFFRQEQLHEFSHSTRFVNRCCFLLFYNFTHKYLLEENLQELKNYIFKRHLPMDNFIYRLIVHYAKEMYEQDLKYGIIFDATYLTKKSRAAFITLQSQYNDMDVYSIYIDTPLRIAYERVQKRSATLTTHFDGKPVYGRSVPLQVLKYMEKTICIPSEHEGFHQVYFLSNNLPSIYNFFDAQKLYQNFVPYGDTLRKDIVKLFPSFAPTIDFCQQNFYHDLCVDAHLIRSAYYIKQYHNFPLFVATLLHDVGKPFTQEFYLIPKNKYGGKDYRNLIISKKTKDSYICHPLFYHNTIHKFPKDTSIVDLNAHYFGHDAVSAIHAFHDCISLNFDLKTCLLIYKYIYYHMRIKGDSIPLSINTLNKLRNVFTEKQCYNLLLLHEADVLHSKIYPTHGFQPIKNKSTLFDTNKNIIYKVFHQNLI